MRVIVFDELTGIHYQHFVAVHDRVQTMGDGEHRAIGEFVANGRLNEFICVGIDVGRCLVQNEDFIVAQNGACQTHQLALAHAEVRATIGHSAVQTAGQSAHQRLQFDLQNKLIVSDLNIRVMLLV